MHTPGKYLIKASSAALLILALASVAALLMGGLVQRAAETQGSAILHVSAVVDLASAALPVVLELICGVLGLAFAGRPKAGRILTVLGVLTFACAAVPFLAGVLLEGFVLRSAWPHLAAMAVALIYVIGAVLNRIMMKKKQPEPEFDN